MKNGRIAAALALCLGASACAGVIGDAAMRLPAAPAEEMEEAALTGIGWGEKGHFELAGARGSFERGAERLEMFDVGNNEGGAVFNVSGGAVGDELEGLCQFSQGDVGLGSAIRVTVEPLFYHCAFLRGGEEIDAHLEISEGGITRDERKGSFAYDGRILELRSVHRMKGTSLPTQTPVGYVFLDEGREVGGVDLNGKTKRAYLPRDPELREAATVASIALAVFWDPQVTGMSD